MAQFARQSFAESPSGDRIVVEVGPALATLERLATAGRAFDLVFVDADKAELRRLRARRARHATCSHPAA